MQLQYLMYTIIILIFLWFCLSPQSGKTKVTIHPGFSKTIPICNYVSRKKSYSWTPICPVFCFVSRICPDLPISAAIYLCVGALKFAQILSLYTKKIAPDPVGGPGRRSPAQIPSGTPRLAPYEALVLDYGAIHPSRIFRDSPNF